MRSDMTIEQATRQSTVTAGLSSADISAALTRRLSPRTRGILRQVFIQLFLLFVLAIVLFPVLWIVSMAVDPRGISRPTDLNLFPPNANLDAFFTLLSEPFSNVLPIYFGEMLMNSLFVSLGTAFFAVGLGASAGYSFSRFDFIGRQSGMLVFIVLLMLPATGTLIPLFILFNSVEVNAVLAKAVPAYFAASVIAALVLLVFRMVRGYTRADPERALNPSPPMVTIAVVVLVFLVIVATFGVLFERSPVYAILVDVPIAEASAPRAEAQEDYDRRVASLPRSQRTAERAALQSEQAAEDATVIQAINDEALIADDLGTFLQSKIDERQTIVPEDEDDFILETLLVAQTTLNESDRETALTALADGVAEADTEVVDRADSAQRAAENAVEAEQDLAAAETLLSEVQATYDRAQATTNGLVVGAMTGMLPYYLLVLAVALVGAGIVWAIMYAVRNTVEPSLFVNGLLIAILVAIVGGIGTVALQQRLSPNLPEIVTLRLTLFGLSIALASSQLPFAIWNLKGYFDTIPKDLEEAALIDGASRISTFFRIMLPLSLPAFAITILFSFMGSWTEFVLSWIFLTGNVQDYTLAMALVSMANGANTAPPDMQKFAAMSVLISLPILALFFAAQRWIVSGLTIGGVK